MNKIQHIYEELALNTKPVTFTDYRLIRWFNAVLDPMQGLNSRWRDLL